MIGKMKSVCASGSAPHFSRLPPSPTPHQPPVPSATLPWVSCQPGTVEVGLGMQPGGEPLACGSPRSATARRCPTRPTDAERDEDPHRRPDHEQQAGDDDGQHDRGAEVPSGDDQQHDHAAPPGGRARTARATGSVTRSLDARHAAVHRIRPSLANSEGCSRNGPTSRIQLRWPCTPDADAGDERQQQQARPTGPGTAGRAGAAAAPASARAAPSPPRRSPRTSPGAGTG